MPEIKKIGFIGTGIMGAAMAGHLMDAGFELSVCNRTRSKADALVARGAKWCDTPAACAAGQDAVITIIGYPKDVEEVYLGENGILKAMNKGSYAIDMTTSSPILAEKIFEEARKLGVHAVDAPVTGGEAGAKAATLSILAGGEESSFEALRPVFCAMGTNLVYEGPAGAGQKTKACNQIAIAGTLAGVCEAFAYAKAAGLDAQKVFASISEGAATSFQMKGVVKNGLDGNFEPGFMIKHFIKDMKIGLETGAAYGLDMPVLKQVLSEARSLEDEGHGAKGTQYLLNYYRRK